MLIDTKLPILGFSAYSGTGKTTLLSKILPLLKAKGIRTAVIKHAHHNFDVDHPGKDSHTLRHAGASQMLIASDKRWALMVETPEIKNQPQLSELLQHLVYKNLDLILVEGFKDEFFSKIELHRASLKKPLLHTKDKNIIAVATDEKIQLQRDLPQLNINDADQVSNFIINYIQLNSHNAQQINLK